MTEKSDCNTVIPEKLLVDNPSDFQFHAAYLAYSEAYDQTGDPETKKQLNLHITALKQNQIDYPTFYQNINQYRETSPRNYGRTLIKTQRKREWRRKNQKQARNQRHKK
ncbi:MAG: hypothetical protein ACLFU9_07120 [Candidatus Bathyarchaeia archaeon]